MGQTTGSMLVTDGVAGPALDVAGVSLTGVRTVTIDLQSGVLTVQHAAGYSEFDYQEFTTLTDTIDSLVSLLEAS